MTAIVTRTKFGPMLVPPFDAYVGQALIRQLEYAPAEFETWRPFLPVDGVVVDVGANIGAHTMAFASVVRTGVIHAIEPQRPLFHMLCGSLALCGVRNVNALCCALGREVGSVRVPALDYLVPQNFGALELRNVPRDVMAEDVASFPLDSLNLNRLDFLKVDVEGMELDVLHGGEGTIAQYRPVISVEADREQNTPAMLAWLRLHGYRAWWHRPPLGPCFVNARREPIVSINLFALHRDRFNEYDEPRGHVEIAIE
jgi:FkbM family methyltransferase